MKRKICVVTSSRAEYGLLYWLLRELKEDSKIDLQLIVTGTHLSSRHGMTINVIESDGFVIDARITMPLDDDTTIGIARSLAVVTVGVAEAISRLKPDLLVLLGDRFEILGAAQAALLARVPIAHIHGGESTEGLIDEAVRHSITKMAHMHFVAAEEFRQRVIQLGELPDRVWTVGATGLDNIEKLSPVEKTDLETFLGVKFKYPSFLFTYHPVTLELMDGGARVISYLQVLNEFEGTIIITGVNADAGSGAIRARLEEYIRNFPNRITMCESLGSRRYLSAITYSNAVVGNSSSGLLEAPAIGVATIDIGDRQRGRPRAPSVIHCDENPDDLRRAVNAALGAEHISICLQKNTPYGKPGAANLIKNVLRDYNLDDILLKRFYSLNSSAG